MKNLLIAFGILDLISFFRLYKTMPIIYDEAGQFSLIRILLVLTILALLITAVLSILKKKSGLYAYYAHFLLKLTATIFTFGFLFDLLNFEYESKSLQFLFGIMIALEFGRLALTILIHRRYFLNKPRPSISNPSQM